MPGLQRAGPVLFVMLSKLELHSLVCVPRSSLQEICRHDRIGVGIYGDCRYDGSVVSDVSAFSSETWLVVETELTRSVEGSKMRPAEARSTGAVN